MENKNNNISFIIPAYNCEKTIKESVDSIINDNYENGDEIIIVDDKSTDDTLNIINDLSLKNQSIKIVKHEKNLGGASARNTAVKNSNNNLIFCLDSDNILEKKSIYKLKDFLVYTNSDAVSFGGLKFFRKDINKITHIWRYQKRQIELSDILCSPITPASSGNYLFTKKSWLLVGGYPEYAGALDTWGFGFKQVANSLKIMALPNSYYFHRHGYNSYWIRDSKTDVISLNAIKIITPYINLIDKNILNYIEKNNETWFNSISKIIKIKSEDKGIIIYSFNEKIKNFVYLFSRFIPKNTKVHIKKILNI
jgi:glycosyltransferase involved in cell wall biosynthesis